MGPRAGFGRSAGPQLISDPDSAQQTVDRDKAASNLAKHGVSFFEGATVFADPFAVYLDDGSGMGPMVVIGTSLRERVLCVVHVERGSRDRIISARPATPGERDVYEKGDER